MVDDGRFVSFEERGSVCYWATVGSSNHPETLVGLHVPDPDGPVTRTGNDLVPENVLALIGR